MMAGEWVEFMMVRYKDTLLACKWKMNEALLYFPFPIPVTWNSPGLLMPSKRLERTRRTNTGLLQPDGFRPRDKGARRRVTNNRTHPPATEVASKPIDDSRLTFAQLEISEYQPDGLANKNFSSFWASGLILVLRHQRVSVCNQSWSVQIARASKQDRANYSG